VLTPPEVEKIAMSMRLERDQVLVKLLAYGGLRIGEALALRWVDVDRSANKIKVCLSVEDTSGTIIVGPTKTAATRDVDLPASLIEQIAELPRKLTSSARTESTSTCATATGAEIAGTKELRHPELSPSPTTCGEPARHCSSTSEPASRMCRNI
jgi:integrase